MDGKEKEEKEEHFCVHVVSLLFSIDVDVVVVVVLSCCRVVVRTGEKGSQRWQDGLVWVTEC